VLLIACPVTHRNELVADRRIRSITNHPTHIALAVACPCGAVHVYRVGRRWEQARAAFLEHGQAQIGGTDQQAPEDAVPDRAPSAGGTGVDSRLRFRPPDKIPRPLLGITTTSARRQQGHTVDRRES
jgi:hypothetical protein